jgi:ABC-type antimicrobial peptide transport system ATPase subunit
MTNEHLKLNSKQNPLETNIQNDWQGTFRKSVLDLDLLNYALLSDRSFASSAQKVLVVTCMDQVIDSIQYTYQGKQFETKNLKHLIEEGKFPYTAFDGLIESWGDTSSQMKEIEFKSP